MTFELNIMANSKIIWRRIRGPGGCFWWWKKKKSTMSRKSKRQLRYPILVTVHLLRSLSVVRFFPPRNKKIFVGYSKFNNFSSTVESPSYDFINRYYHLQMIKSALCPATTTALFIGALSWSGLRQKNSHEWLEISRQQSQEFLWAEEILKLACLEIELWFCSMDPWKYFHEWPKK